MPLTPDNTVYVTVTSQPANVVEVNSNSDLVSVNNKTGLSITLGAGDILLTGFDASPEGSLVYSDTVLQALAKLQNALADVNVDVLGYVLAGLNTGLTGVISSSDNILQAFGRLQNQISNFDASGKVSRTGDTMSGSLTLTGVSSVILQNGGFLAGKGVADGSYNTVIGNPFVVSFDTALGDASYLETFVGMSDTLGNGSITDTIQAAASDGIYVSKIFEAFATGFAREQFGIFLASRINGTSEATISLHVGGGQHGMTLSPNVIDASNAVAYILDSEPLTQTNTRILSVRSNGIEQFYVSPIGNVGVLNNLIVSGSISGTISGLMVTSALGYVPLNVASNLLDLANVATARTNLGLGSAATQNSSAFESAGSVAAHAALTSAVHGITAAAATVLDDTTIAAMRATLGVVNISGDTLTGNLLFTDNLYDIGASGLTRPRTGYFGTSVVSPSFVGALTGNAATATALATARAINGVNFDGTASITITAAASTLTGTTLASNVVASSLTSVGTLSSLTVSGALTATLTGSASLNVLKAGDTMTGALTVIDGTAASPAIRVTTNASGICYDTTNGTVALVCATNRVFAFKRGSDGLTKYLTINSSPIDGFSCGDFMFGTGGCAFGASNTFDVFLTRDGATDTLALRRTTNAQIFRIYNTYTDASNYERLSLKWSSNTFEIASEKLGTGSSRDIYVNSLGYCFLNSQSASVLFRTGGTNRWHVSSTGTFGGWTDNQLDIGNSGDSRPRRIYAATQIVTPALNITAPTVPATAGAAGTTGDIAWDSGFIYVCTATNTWKRATIATW